jgi:hypothetical protein
VTERGPGWPTVLGLVLVVITFSVVNPLHLVAIPLALLLVALPPRTPTTLLVALALMVVAFSGARGTLWHVERGWALLLGGWLIVMVLLWPGATTAGRVIAAVGAAMLSAAFAIVLRGGWEALDHTVAEHYRQAAGLMSRTWPGVGVDDGVVAEWAAVVPARVFPALKGIASAAALAVAWWAAGRVAGMPRRLGRLTEFRFPDGLVWVLIAGLALILLPPAGLGSRLGLNLLVFMGALYALRGLGVTVSLVLAMVGRNRLMLVVLGVIGIMLYPILVAGTVLLGVTDTWLDLRSSRRAVNDEG